MAESYDTKHGFTGLTTVGKLLFLLVLAAAGALVWLIFVRGGFADGVAEAESFIDRITAYVGAIIKIGGGGLVAAYIAQFFLPKLKFYKQEFYCAECGKLIGYSIQRCPRIECGSNRYTTDAALAETRTRKWQKQHEQ